MINSKKAVDAAKIISDYCKQQTSCQNCIFRQFGEDSWKCHIEALDLRDVLANIETKKKSGGWL